MANKRVEFDSEAFPDYRLGDNDCYFDMRCLCEDGCQDCQGTGWVPQSVYVPLWLRFLKWLAK
jgi:hypothetical protein